MSNRLLLFVGKSASGKTTIANLLETRYNLRQVSSYTTRPPRYAGEIGHVFISENEFDELGPLAAFTVYNDHRYGTTFKQLDKCQVYVIDPAGVETLLGNMGNYDRPITIIYFDAAVSTRIMRMVDRGAHDHEIISRLLVDDTTEDWYRNLSKLVWHYKNIEHKDIELYSIDANKNISEVLESVLYYINKSDEGE